MAAKWRCRSDWLICREDPSVRRCSRDCTRSRATMSSTHVRPAHHGTDSPGCSAVLRCGSRPLLGSAVRARRRRYPRAGWSVDRPIPRPGRAGFRDPGRVVGPGGWRPLPCLATRGPPSAWAERFRRRRVPAVPNRSPNHALVRLERTKRRLGVLVLRLTSQCLPLAFISCAERGRSWTKRGGVAPRIQVAGCCRWRHGRLCSGPK
jgi:hypothetical protein